MGDETMDPRMTAGVDLLRRTGAKDFRIGYSDEEDGLPVVWYVVATWQYPNGNLASEAAGAINPVDAVMRLCEAVIDGGTCTHCGQPTIFDADMPMGDVVTELLDRMGCRYAWDPELATFRRSCEGDDE